MTPLTTFTTRLLGPTLLALGLVGCASAPEPLAHSPQFAPVMPVVVEKPRQATGAIYNGRHSDNFFGRSRNYRVGDLITVVLDESTRAGREQKGSVSRDAENNVIPSGLVSKVQNLALPTKVLGTTLGGVVRAGDTVMELLPTQSGLVLEAKGPVVPVAMIDTEKVQQIGQRFPKIRRVGISVGKPLDFSRFDGMEGDRIVLRAVTDEIMYELRKLSGQEYVDVYASSVKENRNAGRKTE